MYRMMALRMSLFDLARLHHPLAVGNARPTMGSSSPRAREPSDTTTGVGANVRASVAGVITETGYHIALMTKPGGAEEPCLAFAQPASSLHASLPGI